MQEASKHLAKSRSPESAQLAALQEASDRISRFVQAHSLIVQDPAAAVSLCQQLLQEVPEQVVSGTGTSRDDRRPAHQVQLQAAACQADWARSPRCAGYTCMRRQSLA